MLRNKRRKQTRHIPRYGIIAVCESHPKLVGEVLDISAGGIGLKIHNKPVVRNRKRHIRLMGPNNIKIDDIPMEIIYVSKTPFVPANNGQNDDHFYRMGVRLTPEREQADKINELIEMTGSHEVSLGDTMRRRDLQAP